MTKRLLIASTLVFACGGAFAQNTPVAAHASTQGEEDSTPAPKRTSNPAPAADSRKAAGKNEAVRNSPRWHSFLPGMFR